MSKIKIADFSSSQFELFASYLKWMTQKHGLDLEIVKKDEFSFENLTDFNSAIIGIEDSEVAQIGFSPAQVRELGVFDCLFFEDQRWYPRLIYYEALRQVLVAEARGLEIRYPAFVAGDGPQVRIILAILSELGISHIYLVGEEKKLVQEVISIQKTRLGLNLKIMKSDDLISQSLQAGLVINTLDFQKYPSVLADLSYFNFLKQGGYVVDLNLLPVKNLFLDEAVRADLRIIKPTDFWARKAQLFFTKLNIENQFSAEFLKLNLEEFLNQKFQLSS